MKKPAPPSLFARLFNMRTGESPVSALLSAGANAAAQLAGYDSSNCHPAGAPDV
jgi:hypothetical protein